MFTIIIFALLFFWVPQAHSTCRDVKVINYDKLTDDDRDEVLNAHNSYRRLVSEGNVPGQPRGKNVLPLAYDKPLEKDASRPTDLCLFEHVLGGKSCQGQNLFLHCSTDYTIPVNWTEAVEQWYNEYKDYTYYGEKKNKNKLVGHYTQLMWQDTKTLGCRHISYDRGGETPFCHLYSCNYFPCGNIVGQSPYDIVNGKYPNPPRKVAGTDNNSKYSYKFQDDNKKDASKVHVTYHTVVRDGNNKIIKESDDDQITVDDPDFRNGIFGVGFDPFKDISNSFNNMFRGFGDMFSGFGNAVRGFFNGF